MLVPLAAALLAQVDPHLLLEYAAGAGVGCSAAILDDVAVVGACDATNGGHTAAGMVHTIAVVTRSSTGVVVPLWLAVMCPEEWLRHIDWQQWVQTQLVQALPEKKKNVCTQSPPWCLTPPPTLMGPPRGTTVANIM